MITWGIVSTCFAFVQGPISFMVLRFLLGVAEAGFFPGMVLYMAASCLLGAIGLLIAAAVPTLSGAMVGISISTLGVIAARPIFWTLPGSFLTGSAAAAGIAFINAFGNLGGFIGPYVIGLIKDQTGSFTLGIVATSLPLALSVVAALVLARRLAPLRAAAVTHTSESVQ